MLTQIGPRGHAKVKIKKSKISAIPKKLKKKTVFKTAEKEGTITPQEFLKLPLSQAILQVIEDIKMIKARGIMIDMTVWWETGDDNAAPCSVCLGGAALCSFNVDAVNGYDVGQYARRILGLHNYQHSQITSAFNDLRQGDIADAILRWNNMVWDSDEEDRDRANIVETEIRSRCKKEKIRMMYNGPVDKLGFKSLIEHLKVCAKVLESVGL